MAQTMIGSPHANVPSQKASGSIQILKKFEKSKFEKLEKFKMNSKRSNKMSMIHLMSKTTNMWSH